LYFITTQRDTEEAQATTNLPQRLRTHIADHLAKRAKAIEQASTDRHVELLQHETEILHLVRSVADQHEAVVCRIADEIKNHALLSTSIEALEKSLLPLQCKEKFPCATQSMVCCFYKVKCYMTSLGTDSWVIPLV
jgi:wobble nucleotide-excising tRNase